MSLHAFITERGWLAGLALALVAGCANAPPPRPAAGAPAPGSAPAPRPGPGPVGRADAAPAAAVPRYRCDHGIEFSVVYGEDSATVSATDRGQEQLLRDAGGVTPQQTAYSNERLRAEFGLGANGDEAVLRYAQPPLVAHCRRD